MYSAPVFNPLMLELNAWWDLP